MVLCLGHRVVLVFVVDHSSSDGEAARCRDPDSRRFGGEACVGGAGSEHPGNGVAGQCPEADVGVEESGEQRSGHITAVAPPGSESLDRLGLGVVAVRTPTTAPSAS